MTWTPDNLRLLRTLNRGGASLVHLAERFGVTPAEIDKALWALVGRSPIGAWAALDGERAA